MVVAATGFFDGVHLGHRAVLEALCAEANASGKQSLALSFWPHPRAVLQMDAAKFRLLTSLTEKEGMIKAAGVDRFEIIPFTKEFASLDTEAFFREYLCRQYSVDTLVVGYDHRLGHSDPKNVTMEDAAKSCGIRLLRVPARNRAGITVSSTKIRMELALGNIATANAWLGYNYALSGVVVEGRRRGRTMGFPTANMRLYEPLKQLPADGVYVTEVRVLDKVYYGMTNIGYCPTVVKSAGRTIETHILDFDEDIYGLSIEIRFLKRLRAEKNFSSLDLLIKQLQNDKLQVNEYRNVVILGTGLRGAPGWDIGKK